MLYAYSYQDIHDWRAEEAQLREMENEDNAKDWLQDCEDAAKNLYPEFRAVCLSDSERLPDDKLDRDDWYDWLYYEFSDGSDEQRAVDWHFDNWTWFTVLAKMEEFFIRNQ